jgi:hypothetical protein
VKSPIARPRSAVFAAALSTVTATVQAAEAPGVPPVMASSLAAEPAVPATDGVRAGDIAAADPVAAPARWRSSSELTAHGYRVSLTRGSLDLGLHFETLSSRVGAEQAIPDPPGPAVSTLPSLSFGLRQGSPTTAGTLLERSTGGGPSSSYVSRFGVEWKPAESRVNFLREGLGIRLEGNDRMTVRLRKGVIGVYMHRKF